MINGNINNSPVRSIKGKAELYNGSALAETITHDGELQSIHIERIGESKFFGFGVCQKLTLKLRDVGRVLDISTENAFKVFFSSDNTFTTAFPPFNVSEVRRDENTNALSITAYDDIYSLTGFTVSQLELTIPYTIQDFAAAVASFMGWGLTVPENASESFSISYDEGANFEGTETLRAALNAVAEATQTIFYLDSSNNLVFRRLDQTGAAVLTISKSDYITLNSGTNRRLTAICSATELGDNVEAALTVSGTTQYVRNNPFWELRDDIDTIVENALAVVGGLTINQFNCSWRGNYLLEIGDKIALETKDSGTVTTYVLNDTIEYNGAFSENTEWSYAENEAETHTNPSNLGEALKQTSAKVDKVNKQIELVVSEVEANKSSISSLQLNTDGISATVKQIEQNTVEAIEAANADIAELSNEVSTKMTADAVQIAIQNELANGVDKVTTQTGFTFDETGLTVKKSTSEMSTQITEDGMTVNKSGSAVLTANNTGVNAANLHATTYLIVGANSRFEDYGAGRTGCFWIGD